MKRLPRAILAPTTLQYVITALLLSLISGVCLAAEDWADDYFPYRLCLQLDRPVSGHVQIAFDIDDLLQALQAVSVDVTDIDTFAFENASLVDPVDGHLIGGFRLARSETPIAIAPLPGHNVSRSAADAWKSYGAATSTIERVSENGDTFEAMWMQPDNIANRGFRLPLELEPGALYLLTYWVYSDPIDNNTSVSIIDPTKTLFVDEHHSYKPTLSPRAQWTRRAVLYQPDRREVALRVAAAFTGVCGVGDIRLQKVHYVLDADMPRETDRLDLYAVLRAGHRLQVPTEKSSDAPLTTKTAVVTAIDAQANDLNPGALLLEDAGVQAWTLASDLPLHADRLTQTEPEAAAEQLEVTLVRGEARTVLVAIDNGSTTLKIEDVTCNLPVAFKAERLAVIPVYDGPTPEGKQIDTRLDPLTPLDFDLAPPSDAGVHILALTLTTEHDTEPGGFKGNIHIKLDSPTHANLDLPVSLTVSPITIAPMRHFGTMFGGQHLQTRYSGGSFTEPSTTVAEYHGLTPDSASDYQSEVERLARAYHNRMLDYSVSPQSLTMYANYSYKVVDRGEGVAPLLTDWNFERYDAAIDAMVLARDVPHLAIYHTNGALMNSLRLAGGAVYTLKPTDDRNGWHRLSPEQYFQLVGDFFEALAAHLDEKGVLDRAVLVIDESDPSTYGLIRDYVLAIKAQPHASRIRVAHTMYKPSIYSRRDQTDRLLLDGIIDMPMPFNDELANLFEPEYSARMTAAKETWVYYVETDHFNLQNAGLSTIVTPLKLGRFGADGWYCWASFIWSMPYATRDATGPQYPFGPVINPWINPFYHHGPGVLSFFYPPDPRGVAKEPTDRIIPSYRLALMREGIETRALLEVLEAGRDDAGVTFAVDAEKVAAAREHLDKLWADNPTQWYLSYSAYRAAVDLLHDAARSATVQKDTR